MPYQFTIDQLAERGYSIYYHRAANEWCWCCIFESRGDYGTKEQVIAAASAHCRENYKPPRPDGVPQHAEFRLPKAGEKHTCITGSPSVSCVDWPISDNDEFNNRRWCWREEEKPKSVTSEICAISTITNEVWHEALMEIDKPGPTGHLAYVAIKMGLDRFWDELVRRDPNPAKMRRELIRIAAAAVRAIHDAKGWEK